MALAKGQTAVTSAKDVDEEAERSSPGTMQGKKEHRLSTVWGLGGGSGSEALTPKARTCSQNQEGAKKNLSDVSFMVGKNQRERERYIYIYNIYV